MNHEEKLLKIFCLPHTSEKASFITKKNYTITLKVNKSFNKIEIKDSIQKLFHVKVKSVRTLIVKGKRKHYGKKTGKRKDWKKAYVTLKDGKNLDLLRKME